MTGNKTGKRAKSIMLAISLPALLTGIGGCAFPGAGSSGVSGDAKRFSQDYPGVPEENVFVYRDADEVISLMESGTGAVYFGYPECPWCQAYVVYLNEAAGEAGLDEIAYCNTKEVREKDPDQYDKMISLLDGYLQYTDVGEQWIYVPNVSFHVNGRVTGNDYETSKDTHDLTDPEEYWTEEEVRELKGRLKEYMGSVMRARAGEEEPLRLEFYYENVCGSCEGDADFFSLYNRCVSNEEKEGLNVEIATYNVFMESCRERYEQTAKRLNIPEGTSLPVLIIGEEYFAGYEEMEASLRRVLLSPENKTSRFFPCRQIRERKNS